MVRRKLPVQRVIRTFLEKRLLRLGPPFPRSCMDKLILNADKNADKWRPCSPTHAIAGFVKEEFRVRVSLLAHNIIYLAPKTMHTNGSNAYDMHTKNERIWKK